MLPSGYSHSKTLTVLISNWHTSRKRSRVGAGAPSGQAETRINWFWPAAATKRSSQRKSLVASLVLCRFRRVVLCSGHMKTTHITYVRMYVPPQQYVMSSCQYVMCAKAIAVNSIILYRQLSQVTNALSQNAFFTGAGIQRENIACRLWPHSSPGAD